MWTVNKLYFTGKIRQTDHHFSVKTLITLLFFDFQNRPQLKPSTSILHYGKWWRSRSGKWTRRSMSWITMGNYMVSYSDFPWMANSVLCGLVVYILAAILCLYISPERSLWGLTKSGEPPFDMCWKHGWNETIMWITEQKQPHLNK